MDAYENEIRKELQQWQKRMQRKPGILSNITGRLQYKINSIIPEKVHKAITVAIKQMIRGVLFGAKHTAPAAIGNLRLQEQEQIIANRIAQYRTTAAAEGGLTGMGGILLSMADFPILLGIKIKLLFDIAALYGFDVKNYSERLYILHVFQLAFSGQKHRREVYKRIIDWDKYVHQLPQDINDFDWRSFQQEYRDYIDIAKLAQLIPGIGAVIGTVVNYKLIQKLGYTAMNAYRMRLFEA